ncbi:ANTAR domain-containing protein [Nocardioides marmoraquaticus]
MSGVQSERFPDPVEPTTAVGEAGDHAALVARVAALEADVENLEAALETRTRIGTAIGLLAERYDTDTDRAWALLTRLSNHSNHKVQEVARLLVAVTDGTLDAHEVDTVGALARNLPRAAAAVGLGDDPNAPRPPRRRRSAPRTRVVAGPVPRGRQESPSADGSEVVGALDATEPDPTS